LVFGRNKKIEFNGNEQPNEKTQDLFQNPQNYSFIHNYKVHFKTSGLQVIAQKVDISVNSSSAQLPTTQEVTSQFNNQMMMMTNNPAYGMRSGRPMSFHITNVEYKESIALFEPNSQSRSRETPVIEIPIGTGQTSSFCKSCGNRMTLDSKFCNKCGTPNA
jgi:hypothetical protein